MLQLSYFCHSHVNSQAAIEALLPACGYYAFTQAARLAVRLCGCVLCSTQDLLRGPIYTVLDSYEDMSLGSRVHQIKNAPVALRRNRQIVSHRLNLFSSGCVLFTILLVVLATLSRRNDSGSSFKMLTTHSYFTCL